MKSFVGIIFVGMLLKFFILLICLNLASSEDQIKFPRENLAAKLLPRKLININADGDSCSSNETKVFYRKLRIAKKLFSGTSLLL
jgi:hypothetical protein